MRKTKRRLESLSFYDHTGIAAHLEKMAAKGWMLERIANYGWVYKKTEPKKLHFAVSYYPKASDYDPEYPEGQQTFHDFCAHTGWELVCTSFQMQVFCNEQENPVPIETDPVLEVETIHAAMVKNFFWGHVVLLVLSVIMECFFVLGLLGNCIAILVDPMRVFSGLCWGLVFVLAVVELTAYFHWHKRAVEAAEQGSFLDTPDTSAIQKASMWLLGIAGVYLIVNFAAAGNTMMLFILGGMAVFMGLTFFAADGIKRLFKKWKLSKNANRVVSFVLTWLVAFMALNLVTFGTVALKEKGFFEQKDGFMEMEHPLRVEDLVEVDHKYVTEGSPKESVFLAYRHVRQRPWFDVEDWSTVPHMEYNLVQVKWPFLYDDVKAQLVKDLTQAAQLQIPYEDRDKLEAVDAVPWGAVEAYQVVDINDDLGMSRYLLCYEKLLVDIQFSWEVTPEQMAIVGEKLR